MRDPLEGLGEDEAREMLNELLDGLVPASFFRTAEGPDDGAGKVSGKSGVRNPWGDIGEDDARKLVRENLRFWRGGRSFTPEDLLQAAWFDTPPWVVRLEGKTLKALQKLAGLEEWSGDEFYKAVLSIRLWDHWELFRLRQEGRWDRAVEMIRHPEKYGPVGDVLDLGWTREAELEEWIEASAHSWGAYEGVRRLLKRVQDSNEPIPDALGKWAVEVAIGDRSKPTIAHRPASATYRNEAIVRTIGALITDPWDRAAGIKKLTIQTACLLVAEELDVDLETVLKIWQEGKRFSHPEFTAPAVRPFPY